jgi:hypothetical protein
MYDSERCGATQSRVVRKQDSGRWKFEGGMAQSNLETLTQRLVYAGDGMRWRIREALAHDVPGAESPACLIFDGGHICRRVWHYPEKWSDLSDESLLGIMEHLR